MATNYPGSLDTGTEQPSPLSTTEMDDAGFEHDVVHTNHSGAIIALETKVGTGSSTAVADSVLAGTGSGTSGWSTAPSLAGLTVDTDTLHVDATNDRVGIGTTTPATKLDIDTGSIGGTSGDTLKAERWYTEAGSNDTFMEMKAERLATGTDWTTVGWRLQHQVDSTPMAFVQFNDDEAGNDRGLLFGTNNTVRMTIANAGNVGIGTTSPTESLTVAGDARIGTATEYVLVDYDDEQKLEIVEDTATGRPYLSISNQDASGNLVRKAYFGYPTNASDASVIDLRSDTGDLRFLTYFGEVMRLDSSGNVGIGTATPRGVFDVATSGSVYLIHNTLQQGTVDTYLGGHVFFSPWDTTDDVYLQARRSNDSGNTNMYFRTTNSGSIVNAMRITSSGNVGIGTASPSTTLDVNGSLSKNSGSFKIPHPLPAMAETHNLVHSFVEAPQADNIYRGRVALVDGAATVDLDVAANMTTGTFELLNRDLQCFIANNEGWTAVRGSVSGSTLTIEAQDASCADTVDWLVVGERHDQHMYDTEWTDDDGRVIVEPLRPAEPEPETEPEPEPEPEAEAVEPEAA